MFTFITDNSLSLSWGTLGGFDKGHAGLIK